jgi:hypothetical protein
MSEAEPRKLILLLAVNDEYFIAFRSVINNELICAAETLPLPMQLVAD